MPVALSYPGGSFWASLCQSGWIGSRNGPTDIIEQTTQCKMPEEAWLVGGPKPALRALPEPPIPW